MAASASQAPAPASARSTRRLDAAARGARAAAKRSVGARAAGRRARIGLALAGGGPLGAIYEIGALCALQEALVGVRFDDLDAYVGVSAGGCLAAGLANGMSPRQLCDAFIGNGGDDRIDPSQFVRPAWGEFARRIARLPRLLLAAGRHVLLQRGSLLSTLELLGRALPVGVFSSAQLEALVRRLLEVEGRSNDFRKLQRKLVLVATDLDSGEAVAYGQPGLDHVPISQAVAASAALPGLFAPVRIEGRDLVDGALKKTLHASVLLDDGVDLLLCLNPLMPFDARASTRHRVLAGGEARIPRLVDGGLPVVLSQTFRSLIHSRLELGLKRYRHTHPHADIVLFEPEHHDPAMFSANTFSYAQRRALAEHAYQRTRADLRSRRGTLSATLAPHGVRLDDALLDDPRRTLLGGKRRGPTNAAHALRRLDEVLDDLQRALAVRTHAGTTAATQ